MKPKFYIVTTVPRSLGFFLGQYNLLEEVFDITAVSSEKSYLEDFGRQQGIKTHFIPMERDISVFSDIKSLFLFIRFFSKERPQIVHGNTPKGSLLSMLAAWITRVPIRIYMCHGLRYQGCVGLKKKLLMFMEKISCQCATHIVCVSKGVKSVLATDHITKKEPIVVWNGSVRGIDTVKFDPKHCFDKVAIRNYYGIRDTDFVLTFLGRIVKDKGINELVDAFSSLTKKYPTMKLLLVGRVEDVGNSISEQTKRVIEATPTIIAPGMQQNVPEILSITDLFVFPSYREGLGLSLMEAGAMGIPSVATNIIGCNEVVIDGETGILIPPHSSQDIFSAVERLYTDKQLYYSMKKQCRTSIVSRYESNRLIQKYIMFYTSLISEDGATYMGIENK